jgi:hypothetical protein
LQASTAKRNALERLQVRKQYMEYIYYHCVDIIYTIHIFIFFLSFEACVKEGIAPTNGTSRAIGGISS